MLFMVNETWPSKSSLEVGKKTVEILKRTPPPYLKQLGTYVAAGGDGIKAYALYEAEKGHADEGYREIVNVFAQFLTIQGYRFTVEPVLPADEALPLVGLGLG